MEFAATLPYGTPGCATSSEKFWLVYVLRTTRAIGGAPIHGPAGNADDREP